jgi:hypothetical protein
MYRLHLAALAHRVIDAVFNAFHAELQGLSDPRPFATAAGTAGRCGPVYGGEYFVGLVDGQIFRQAGKARDRSTWQVTFAEFLLPFSQN